MDTYIKGNYKRTIFTSGQGYVVGLFKIKETNDEMMTEYVNRTITFTGYFAELNEDDLYIFYGKTNFHPRYGIQFDVSNYEKIKPSDELGLISFLSSDLFKGVGEKLAKQIVDTLGLNALDEILKDESCLLLVPKLTQKKAHQIYETLNTYEKSHQITVYLSNLGFSIKDALSIYNMYKDQTISIIESNPYRLYDDELCNFSVVDKIALNFDMDPCDNKRIEACIIYVMKQLLFESGDTYLYYDEIYNGVSSYLNIDIEDSFSTYLDNLINRHKVCYVDKKYYIKEMYDSENNIVDTLSLLIKDKIVKNKKILNCIEEIEKNHGIVYNDQQKEAIVKALDNNITVITGGPGTGKTTIIKAICEVYQMINNLGFNEAVNKIALLAPTGRASKKMSEATLMPASTIHRFLKWNMDTGEFLVNEYNPDMHHLIIVDEFSMVDLQLFDSLLNGLTRNIKLVLVGDYNQLPSVGPGNVLKDLIESDVIDTIYLEHLYRQDEDSYIPTLAQEIKNNELSEQFLTTKSDYTFLKCNNELMVDTLEKICHQLIEKGYDYKRVQIMAPMYASNIGIDSLNMRLQNIFNPKTNQNEIKYGDVIYRENDKVLQLVNDPDNFVSNGDIGVIKSIIKDNGKTVIFIDFDGNIVSYKTKDLNKIKHGFVVSIHKSQGSEFELCIVLVSNSYKRMLYRKLIYTAVTRAKKKLIIIGNPDAFVYAVNNNFEKERKTALKDKLMHNIIKS